MMEKKSLEDLISNNKKWARACKDRDPEYFASCATAQNPQILWIGCSDSRVPAESILGLKLGEVFVHRNIANLVLHAELSSQAVIQYAVDVLQVSDIIVCGHYGCGGVNASLNPAHNTLTDIWIRSVRDTYVEHRARLDNLRGDDKVNALVELNVKKQVSHLSHTVTVQNAWSRGQNISIHGMVYDMESGLIKDLDLTVTRMSDIDPAYRLSAPT